MRRAAAFCLIVCLLLAVTVPATAAPADFPDLSQIENRAEVSLLAALGMIAGGSDGRFHPADGITRAETAKLIALLLTDTPEGRSDGRFYDVGGHWAESYIYYCAARGVISGDGRGAFRPQDPVTGRELAKMLLLVVDGTGSYTGGDWAAQADADARAQGIYDRFQKDPGAPISRDDACLLIYNAMQCLAVTARRGDGAAVYAMDALMNPVTFLEYRFGVTRYTSILTGNEYADLTAGGKLAQGRTKLAGHAEFQVSTDLSLLGRCVDVYVRDGQVLSAPCVSLRAASYTFGSTAELEQLCSLTDYSLDPDGAYYFNYAPSGAQKLDALPPQSEITVIDEDGDHVFEQILMVSYTLGVVEEAAPLTVRIAGGVYPAEAFRDGDVFTPGQTVLCVQVNGVWFLQ